MTKPTETLQNYLDDLLFDTDDSLDRLPDSSALPIESQPKQIDIESTEVEETSTDFEMQLYLAEEKKRQLQQLLMPHSVVDETVVDDTVVEEPVVENSTAEDLIDSEPVNTIAQESLSPPSSVQITTKVLNTENVPQVHSELEDISTSEINHIEKFLTWGENGRPVWAQHKFDALLFEVSGLALAVPLIALGQIINLSPDKLTPLFGRSEWFMGLLTTALGQIRVINTALFVMPERYEASFLESVNYVISMDGQPWGLAVDRVTQPITLDPEDVKWRSERTSRPWLAGTVKTKMCALIDIPQMAKLLNTPDNGKSQ